MNRYRKYTKGDCYTICELLEFLLQNKTAVYKFSQEYNYESDYVLGLLKSLLYDTDSIIGDEQTERDDTDQMADIMQIVHISGHND